MRHLEVLILLTEDVLLLDTRGGDDSVVLSLLNRFMYLLT